MGRRFVAGLVVVGALLGAWAAPAAAASGPTHVASAFWDLGDPMTTRVSLQASRSGSDGSLFLFVTQSYCDTATDQLVFRSFFSSAPLAPQEFSVLPNLKGAKLAVTTTVSGSETRVPNCASPDYNNQTFQQLPASSVTITANWVGTGSTYEVQPGITGRAATATGSITGTVLNPGSLGTSQNAELRQVAAQ